MSSRWVVVCRPLPSARTSAVARRLVTRQAIHERRLAGTARADEHGDQALEQDFAQARESRARRVDRDDLGSGGDRSGGAEVLINVIAEVGLGEQHDRSRSARPGHGECAFDATELQRDTERDGDEDEVDVGRNRLARGRDAGRTTHEHAASRQHMHRNARVDDQPVAGGDASIVRDAGERGCKRDALLAGIGQDRDHAPVDADDEAPAAVGGGVSERGFECPVPP